MTVSYESDLARAQALRDEADKIEKTAFNSRPLPDKWRVGQTVRYLKDRDWAWSRGQTALVKELRSDYRGLPAAKYQVFYTGPEKGKKPPIYWTTPDDVELVEDVKAS
jgi:hypothetical protein